MGKIGTPRPNNRGTPGNKGGRPKGSKSQITADIALAATAADVTPIEVKLAAMRRYFGRYEELVEAGADQAECDAAIDRADEIATTCAPYCHPRLNAIAAQVNNVGKSDGDDNVRFIAMMMMHVLREAKEEGREITLEEALAE